MSQIEKQVEKFLKNPTSVKYAVLIKILRYYNFEVIEAKGSHVKFKHSHFAHDLVLPVHKGDCKDFYKKEAAKLIRTIQKKK